MAMLAPAIQAVAAWPCHADAAAQPSQPRRRRAQQVQKFQARGGYLASAGALVASCRARKAHFLRLRATSSTILIDEATSGDLLPAADVAVRALRWTEG
ncbi:unnamed protein product, partial [Cladocopium goreaui]